MVTSGLCLSGNQLFNLYVPKYFIFCDTTGGKVSLLVMTRKEMTLSLLLMYVQIS